MSEKAQIKSAKFWLLLFVIMASLAYMGYFLITEEIQRDRQQLVEQLDQEFSLLTNLSTGLLQSGDYEGVQSVFDEWVVNYPDVIEINLTSSNGFSIAKATRSGRTLDRQSVEARIKYGYRGNARLLLVKDTSWIYGNLTQNILFTSFIWLLIGIWGSYLIRNLVRQKRNNIQLKKMSEELKEANSKLITEKTLLNSLIDNIPDLISFKDCDGVYMGCNRAFRDFAACEQKQTSGKTDFDFFDDDLAQAFVTNDKLMMQSKQSRRNEEWVTYPDGKEVLLDTLKTPYYDERGNVLGLIGVSRDITELKEYQNQLEDMAYHDMLTHLPNRRYLIERMKVSISQCERENCRLAICNIDLDGFQEINDRYGHEIGDRILTEFANRLSNASRSGDTVARWGGDEFTLLFTNLHNADESIELVERVQHLLDVPLNIENDTFNLQASIGLTIYPDDNSDADTLLRHADQAMYEAKLSGKSHYRFFDPEQNQRIHSHHERRLEINEAINNQQLILFYQPQVHLRQGAPYGVEALVRWNHPQKGILPPGEFLPYIHDHEISIGLDWWVLTEAVSQLSDWLAQGRFFHLSVNISALTFKQSDFVSKLSALMSSFTNVSAEMISLELLESTALGDLDKVATKMKECQSMGFQFSLDDFGTSYSSLTYLSRLPSNVLKIDQSFVRDMLVDEGDANIVEGIIRLAAAFNRMVIAEGVEEIMHGVKLIEMGCTYAQGYAIAKPMPASSLDEWMVHFKAPEEWLKLPKPQLSVLDGHNHSA